MQLRNCLAVFLTATLLAGCEHYLDLHSTDFHPGATAPDRFAKDNDGCRNKAVQVQAQAGGNGDPHGIYNRVYRSCMEALAYRPVNPNGFDGW